LGEGEAQDSQRTLPNECDSLSSRDTWYLRTIQGDRERILKKTWKKNQKRGAKETGEKRIDREVLRI